MENIKKGTPKDVFLHLLAVVTLYISVVAFITLWWQYINVLFPDLLQYKDYGYGSSAYDPIRWATAALVIVFPVHVLISWLIGLEMKSEPEKREIRVRKWLWYITLFFSALTIIIDLVTLVYNFLQGELSVQFFLKVLVVLAVAGAVFGYYLWDLRKRDKKSDKPKIMTWIVSAAILASIIYGFFLIGSPSTQRARRFDEQRVNDLSVIQGETINYWQQRSALPASLDNLKNDISGFVAPVDPETRQPYEYATTGQLSFKLCAMFKTSMMNGVSGRTTPMSAPMPMGGYYPYQQNWDHGMGRMCFERTIDPKIYRPIDKAVPVPLKY